MRLLLLAALAVAPLVASSQATFQTDARPVSGTLSPRADRAPEALDLTLRSPTESPRTECPGSFDLTAPDAVVDWRGGTLWMTVRSSTDATLAVYGPDGAWTCNDDGEGLAPVVEWEDAPRGRYVVWVGSFAQQGGGAATLLAGTRPAPLTPDAQARPAADRIDAASGIVEMTPIAREVAIGGIDAVASLAIETDSEFGCSGFIDAARPTVVVRYTGGGPDRLLLQLVAGTTDTVLLVRTPSGTWLCDDDSGPGSAAAVAIPNATGGDYVVWGGTYGGTARTAQPTATLTVSDAAYVDPDEMDMDDDFDMDMDFDPTPYAPATYTPLDLDAAPAVRLALRAGADAASTEVRVQPSAFNPLSGPTCSGYLEPAATADLTLGGSGPIGITATAEMDLVLAVQTPAGDWFCSDDADGFNPGVQIDQPEPGRYRVWVGVFGETMDAVEATLAVARGEIVVTQPDEFGMDLDLGDPFSEGVYSGQGLQEAGRAATTLTAPTGGSPQTAEVQASGEIESPVAGPACSGFLSADPTAALTAAGDVSVSARSDDADLVLVIRTSDGQWFCSDDADASSNPRIDLSGLSGGLSRIWVGTFSRADMPVPATLQVSR